MYTKTKISSKPSYAIIGQGRLGKHLANYFTLLNIEFIAWDYRKDKNLDEVIEKSEIILLAIPDKFIDSFIRDNIKLQHKVCIHFSGALVSDLALGFHPLMTFSDEMYTKEQYNSILFVGDDENIRFKDIFPQLPNASAYIPKQEKCYYHAMCVLANNFSTILWQKFCYEMESRFDIPQKFMREFTNQTMLNIMNDYKQALTGPLTRNDQVTITNNLKALENDEFKDVFQSFVEVYKNFKSKLESGEQD